MMQIRRARPEDARAIATVHVESWQDSYPGILGDDYLAGLSVSRLAAGYRRALLTRFGGEAIFVACDPAGEVVGFASAARNRREAPGEGEIQTLYLLSDWRDMGLGRRLMRAAAAHLAATGCRSAMLWVLSANGAKHFYRRLGGRQVARETIRVGGREVEQTALLWDPIGLLLDATATQREG